MDERSEEVAHVRGKLRAAGANPRLCRELLVMWTRGFADQTRSLDCISGYFRVYCDLKRHMGRP